MATLSKHIHWCQSCCVPCTSLQQIDRPATGRAGYLCTTAPRGGCFAAGQGPRTSTARSSAGARRTTAALPACRPQLLHAGARVRLPGRPYFFIAARCGRGKRPWPAGAAASCAASPDTLALRVRRCSLSLVGASWRASCTCRPPLRSRSGRSPTRARGTAGQRATTTTRRTPPAPAACAAGPADTSRSGLAPARLEIRNPNGAQRRHGAGRGSGSAASSRARLGRGVGVGVK